IADTFEVSRQAVYDNIRRTGDLVEDYEQKLKLYEKFEQRRQLYYQMKQVIHQPDKVKDYIEQLEELE
ncbi:MAG: DNA-binding protein, partial [Staphylococcus lugdunensis]|nr:DNA-binding protein [Staphylococcus lugdunensis]